jgi:hypothetical protein
VKLDLVGVQEVGTRVAVSQHIIIHSFYRKRNDNHHLSMHKRLKSAVKMVEFLCNRISHIILRTHCNILNVHALPEDKNDKKDHF